MLVLGLVGGPCRFPTTECYRMQQGQAGRTEPPGAWKKGVGEGVISPAVISKDQILSAPISGRRTWAPSMVI